MTKEDYSKKIEEILSGSPTVYVCRDLERAEAGINLKNFFVITNLEEGTPNPDNLLAIKKSTKLDTDELLQDEKAQTFLKEKNIKNLLVFKPTTQTEDLAKKLKLTLLNPPSALARSLEEKITVLKTLEDLGDIFVPFETGLLAEIPPRNFPYILQFNTSHTGSGTHFIEDEKALKRLTDLFPKRQTRRAKFYDTPILTANLVIGPDFTITGSPSLQITGLEQFTTNRFATVGNDWTAGHRLADKHAKDWKSLTSRILDKLKSLGWRGLFGIDVIATEQGLKLLEINARQPASTSWQSRMEKHHKPNEPTLFELHLGALLDLPLLAHDHTRTELTEGAQIVLRVKTGKEPEVKLRNLKDKLTAEGWRATLYKNNKIDADLLRLQTITGQLVDENGQPLEKLENLARLIELELC